ncbi:MAG: type II secretion system F family protein, partial [Pseudomonadales bacterium]
MAAFSYVALSRDGKQKKGILDADSARAVRQMLREQSLMPMEVEPAAQNEARGAIAGGGFSFGRPSLKVADLALITRQLATLVQAGIPLEEALGTVARQSEKARISGILSAVRAKVLEGFTLAGALGEFPQAFSGLYRSTVAAGESAGHLDAVLEKLADYTEASQASRQK